MSGALTNGKSSTTMPRNSVPKWKVCHTIKAAPTYFISGGTGYVVCFMIPAIHFLMLA